MRSSCRAVSGATPAARAAAPASPMKLLLRWGRGGEEGHGTNGRLSPWNARDTSPYEFDLETTGAQMYQQHGGLFAQNRTLKWGELHVLHLLQNGWMPRILQEIVTFSAIGSSKLLTVRVQEVYSARAYYRRSINSFRIIRTSMRNTTRNISMPQNPRDISGRRTLHYAPDCRSTWLGVHYYARVCRSTLLALNQLQCLQRLI